MTTAKKRTITLSEFILLLVLAGITLFGLNFLAMPVESGSGKLLHPTVIAGDISSLLFVKIFIWFAAFMGILIALRGVSSDLWDQAIGPEKSQPAANIIVGIALALAWVIGR